MLYAIAAAICVAQGRTITVPTFYLDGQALGLESEHEAAAFARRIVDPLGVYTSCHIWACPVTDYLLRTSSTVNQAACALTQDACDR